MGRGPTRGASLTDSVADQNSTGSTTPTPTRQLMNESVDVVDMPDQLTAFDASDAPWRGQPADPLGHHGHPDPGSPPRSGTVSVDCSTTRRDGFRGCVRRSWCRPCPPPLHAGWSIPTSTSTFISAGPASPTPGTLRNVLDMAELMVQAPLDISRPLWSVTLVEDMSGGRSAVLMHMSHAMSDGMGSVAMFEQIFDFEADAPPNRLRPFRCRRPDRQ